MTTDISTGEGVALDPAVITISAAEYEELKRKGAQVPVWHDPIAAAHENLANAQAFVENQKAHLAGAEQALVEAEAELAAVLAEHGEN